MNPSIHSISAAGNAAVLALLAAILCHADTFFRYRSLPERPTKPSKTAAVGSAEAEQVVLVIVDALRVDTASDPEIMPSLNGLAMRGGSSVVWVESLIPCSIAAILTLSSGRVPPPAVFLQDFSARPADDGGLFAALRQQGGKTFVAGPSLWTEAYGEWIADAEVDPTFGRRDQRLLNAAISAICSKRYRLVVLHLSNLDRVAHRWGANSVQYEAAARWSDDAISQVAAILPPGASLVVTSDHGSTDVGGHAGPEPEVIRTPLVTYGPGLPRGNTLELVQRDVHHLLSHVMGLDRPQVRPAESRVDRRTELLWLAGIFAVLCWSCLRIWTTGSTDGQVWRKAFALNSAVWGVLILIVLGHNAAALGLAVVSLLGIALLASPRRCPGLLAAFLAGIALGLARWTDTWLDSIYLLHDGPGRSVAVALASAFAGFAGLTLLRQGSQRAASWHLPRWLVPAFLFAIVAWMLGGVYLLLAYLLGYAAGLAIGALARSHAAFGPAWMRIGPALALFVAPVVLNRGLGRTTSLSTLDMHAAIHFAELPAGPVLAAIVATLAHMIPMIGSMLGFAPCLVKLPRSKAAMLGAFLAAIGFAQAVPAGFFLVGFAENLAVESLAIGSLVHALAELVFLFTTLGAILLSRPILDRYTWFSRYWLLESRMPRAFRKRQEAE